MGVKEIQTAIAQLSPRELAELIERLRAYHARDWDQKIEEDLETGRLDAVLAEADWEYEAGLARGGNTARIPRG
jgi:hypothetical protein